ncbi:MAG: tRNA(Met) cytidine acetyltransferase TmcA [Fervidicoccaceae archaeon]
MLGRREIEEISREKIAELLKSLSPSLKKLSGKIRRNTKRYLESRHRRLIVLSGGDPGKQGFYAAYIIHQYSLELRKLTGRKARVLYIYHDELEESRIRKEVFRQFLKMRKKGKESGEERRIDIYEKSDKYLGTTFDALVLDLSDDLRPNDVGRLVETVRGGGIVIFIAPDLNSWGNKLTIFKQRLLVPGYSEPRHVFISWFIRTLMKAEGTYIYDLGSDRIVKNAKVKLERPQKEQNIEESIPEKTKFPRKLYELALTTDQVMAAVTLETLIDKPRKGWKKVVLITADRGRGKSCALGIGLIGIAESMKEFKHKVRIIVTSPEPQNVQSLFLLAKKAAEALGYKVNAVQRGGNIIELQGPFFSIEYWSPLSVPKIKGDIVAVDEASGIHVPLLMNILKSHDRIAFSATLHGYEGGGRGFSVRFLGELKNMKNIEISSCELKTPIRYGEEDPVEKWLYRTLLLDAEPDELDENDIQDIERGDLEYVSIRPEELFTEEKEKLLRSIFGIYVLAHYRNQPDDLAMLADAPHHLIRAVMTKNSRKVLCSLQLAVEGGLDEQTVDTLLRGNKIPGNIIPDRVLKHIRIWEMGFLRGIRIVRIATHPRVQSKGIGSFALKKLVEEATAMGMDWVGSGFGVNNKLLSFWIKNGFTPIHMSPDRNPISGEYTVIVLKGLSSVAKEIVELGRLYMKRKLVKSLRDVYKDLESDVAISIIRSTNKVKSQPPKMSEMDIDRLWIYVYGPMTYEAVSDIMWELARFYFESDMGEIIRLGEREEIILLQKVLQGRSWEEISRSLHLRDIDVMQYLKDAARELLKGYYGKDSTSPVGIHIAGEKHDSRESS